MQLTTLQKFGGISLIAGSVLLTVYSLGFTFLLPVREMHHDVTIVVNDPNWIRLSLVAFFGVILMIFGFIAVYSRLYAESGLVGFLGFLFILLAYVLQAGKVTWEICLYPVIASHESSVMLLRDFIIKTDPHVIAFKTVSSVTIFLGIVLFCLALVRTDKFPKIAGSLFFAGAFIYGLGPVLANYLVAIAGIFILSVGSLVLGLVLIRSRDQQEHAGLFP
jgi:hypothetical protein